jgi:hypothetical protein
MLLQAGLRFRRQTFAQIPTMAHKFASAMVKSSKRTGESGRAGIGWL